MAKWSVALFGHNKPNFSMIEIGTDTTVVTFVNEPAFYDKLPVTGLPGWLDGLIEFPNHVYRLHPWVGNEKRNIPGDVVAFKEEDGYWSETERKHFLIATIDGPTHNQMEALCEMEHDLSSYKAYEPDNLQLFYDKLAAKAPEKADPIEFMDKLDANKEIYYDNYLNGMQRWSAYPLNHWRKSRFNVAESVLQNAGVDLVRMKDKNDLYAPLVTFNKLDMYDKLRQRAVTGDDTIDFIWPRTLEEMQNPKTVEELLTELRA
jgi:hypothetical protein